MPHGSASFVASATGAQGPTEHAPPLSAVPESADPSLASKRSAFVVASAPSFIAMERSLASPDGGAPSLASGVAAVGPSDSPPSLAGIGSEPLSSGIGAPPSGTTGTDVAYPAESS